MLAPYAVFYGTQCWTGKIHEGSHEIQNNTKVYPTDISEDMGKYSDI